MQVNNWKCNYQKIVSINRFGYLLINYWLKLVTQYLDLTFFVNYWGINIWELLLIVNWKLH